VRNRKGEIDFNTICKEDSKGGFHSCKGVFSDRAEMLANRADILNGKDKALLNMYLKNGMTFRQIAYAAGTTELIIGRRIHALTAKLAEGDYITCLQNRDKFNRVEMAVAKDYYLDDISQKAIAKKRRMTVYTTRKVLRNIREIVAACGG
jgi:hypothetical protein